MIYLKLFQTHSDYNTYISGQDKVLPNVSYCENENEVHYNPYYAPIVAKFNVTSTSSATGIAGNTSWFSEIWIDGVKQPSVVNGYTFSTIGEHTVKYTLIDPTTIGVSAFGNLNSLTSVTIPDTITSINTYAFGACTSLTSITIPNGVTSIGDSAFNYCTGLTSVTIPDGVTTIGGYAFAASNGLTNVTIGCGVTSIGNSAFYNCTSLESVTIQATTPPTLGSSAFSDNASGRKIYVPSASVATYQAASGWSDYASDIEAIPSA